MNDEISVQELKAWRETGHPYTLIDVRDPEEYARGNLGGKSIPLRQILSRQNEIPREGPVVLQCKAGGRSRKALEALREAGFANLVNLAGGIAAWSREIDPSVSAA